MGMKERLCRVMATWADHHDPDAWRAYQGVARLILAEMRHPTEAMTEAMYFSDYRWRAAIDAALAEPDQIAPE